jgi:hypothetical protein
MRVDLSPAGRGALNTPLTIIFPRSDKSLGLCG